MPSRSNIHMRSFSNRTAPRPSLDRVSLSRIGDVPDLSTLLHRLYDGRLSDCNRSMVVLASRRGLFQNYYGKHATPMKLATQLHRGSVASNDNWYKRPLTFGHHSGVCTEYLNPHIMVMKPAKNRV